MTNENNEMINEMKKWKQMTINMIIIIMKAY